MAALGGSPDRLLKDLEWVGLLFESLVIRDLRVLAQALDGEVLHYRDDYGVEVDTIVQLRDGRWGAIEIKLGPPLQRLPRPFSCKRHWLVLEVGDGAQLRVSRDQRQEAGLGRLNPAPNGIPGHPRPLDPRSVPSG